MALDNNKGSDLRPRFNLGGQVSNHLTSSASNLHTTSVVVEREHLDEELDIATNKIPLYHRRSLGGMNMNSYTEVLDLAHTTSDYNGRKASLNPDLLMREFTHDEQFTTASPSSMFKSSFAKEVVQNVRKSMTSLQVQESIQQHSRSIEANDDFTSSDALQQQQQPLSYRTLPNRRKIIAFSENVNEISSANKNMDKNKSENTFEKRQSLNESDMWMSSTQFVQLLDKQEEAQSQPQQPQVLLTNGDDLSFNSDRNRRNVERNQLYNNVASKRRNVCDELLFEKSNGFLDENALVPLQKLKKTCHDLGFTHNEEEWNQIEHELREMKENENNFVSGNKNSNSQEDEELFVRNGDFFAILNSTLNQKQQQQQQQPGQNKNEGNKRSYNEAKFRNFVEDNLKESIGSGHELESCRSSDSGLDSKISVKNPAAICGNAECTRAAIGREHEICLRERELAQCYRDLAERDTDLARVRMECQRLLEDNRVLKETEVKLRLYSNPRKHLELEKEIEHLKWQLAQMESSRKTYELATQRLVSFLDEVTSALQSASPAHRKLVDATKAEVSRVARRTNRTINSNYTNNSTYKSNKRLSLDSAGSAHNSLMFRAESMPGLNLEIPPRLQGSVPSTSSNVQSSESSKARRVQRSQSTHSKRSPLPSMEEEGDQINPYENHSIIEMAKGEILEEEEDEESVLKEQEELKKSILKNKNNHSKKLLEQNQEEEISVKPKANPKKVSTKSNQRNEVTAENTPKGAESAKKRHSFLSNRSKSLAEVNRKSRAPNSLDQDSGRSSLGSHSGDSSGRSTPNVRNKNKVNENNNKENGVEAAAEDNGGVVIVLGQKRMSKKDKFASLGNLQIEPALPSLPISGQEDNEQLVSKAQRMMKSMKSLMARERTLTITPKKSKSWKPNSSEKKPPNLQLLSQNFQSRGIGKCLDLF